MTWRSGSRVRVMVVDDQDLYRRGLAILLAAEADIDVVGEAASCASAISLNEAVKPDVVLLDLSLAEAAGASVQQTIAALTASVKVLILVGAEVEPGLQCALDRGADGFLLKRAPIEELAAAVRAAVAAQVPPS